MGLMGAIFEKNVSTLHRVLEEVAERYPGIVLLDWKSPFRGHWPIERLIQMVHEDMKRAPDPEIFEGYFWYRINPEVVVIAKMLGKGEMDFLPVFAQDPTA
jgi:hypothetical protein